MSRPYGQVPCVRDKLHAVEVYSRKIGSRLVNRGKPLGDAMRVTKDDIAKSDSNIIGIIVDRAATLAWKFPLRGYDAVHLASAVLWQETLET